MWSLLLKDHITNIVLLIKSPNVMGMLSVMLHSTLVVTWGTYTFLSRMRVSECAFVGTLISWMSPWHKAPDGRRAIFITCIVDFHSLHESSLTDQHESDARRLRRRCRGWTGAFSPSQRVLMMYFMWRRLPWICIRPFTITLKGRGRK